MTSGSAFMAANGPRSDSRQRRISNRSVRMLSNLAITRGSVAARTARREPVAGDRDVLAERQVREELAEQRPELERVPAAAAADHQRAGRVQDEVLIRRHRVQAGLRGE